MKYLSSARLHFPLLFSCLVLFWVLSSPPETRAGFSTVDGKYKGEKLTPGQKTMIADAINLMETTTNGMSAQHKAQGKKIAAGLRRLLADGRICKGTGTAKANGVTDAPRKTKRKVGPDSVWTRSCKDDDKRINIRCSTMRRVLADSSQFKEPNRSQIAAILYHEGVHMYQWGLLDSQKKLERSRAYEWQAYAAEYAILCARIPALPNGAEKNFLIRLKKRHKWRRDVNCDRSLTTQQAGVELAKCKQANPSRSAPCIEYIQSPDDFSMIDVTDSLGVMYSITTPFAATLSLATALDASGGDILVAGGTDASGFSGGGVVVYTDVTADGLADESTEFSIGTPTSPISLAFVNAVGPIPNQLFILDYASRDILFAPTDPSGVPGPIAPTPFVPGFSHPNADRLIQITGQADPGFGVLLWVSPFDETTARLDHDWEDIVYFDFNGDFVPDFVDVLSEDRMFNPPLISTEPQAGDTELDISAHEGHGITIHVSDATGTVLIENLGSAIVPSADQYKDTPFTLSRALVAGEYVVAVDDTMGAQLGEAKLVDPPDPEIFGTDSTEYFPGDSVSVMGRNFGANPKVWISDIPVAGVTVHSDNRLSFVAPNMPFTELPLYLFEVEASGVRSQHAGVYIIPDCNGNGIDDLDDILAGTSMDLDENLVPDECPIATGVAGNTPSYRPLRITSVRPNPLTSIGVVEFEMDEAGPVEVDIFDVAGRRVHHAETRGVSGILNVYRFDETVIGRLGGGVYFVRLKANGVTHARKLAIVR